MSSFLDRTKFRSGRWTPEEEEFAAFLIHHFKDGMADDAEEGTSLRAYLAKKLGTNVKRVSKKYEGTNYNGKQVYWKNAQVSEVDLAEYRATHDQLKESFEESVRALEGLEKAAKTFEGGATAEANNKHALNSSKPKIKFDTIAGAAAAAAAGRKKTSPSLYPATRGTYGTGLDVSRGTGLYPDLGMVGAARLLAQQQVPPAAALDATAAALSSTGVGMGLQGYGNIGSGLMSPFPTAPSQAMLQARLSASSAYNLEPQPSYLLSAAAVAGNPSVSAALSGAQQAQAEQLLREFRQGQHDLQVLEHRARLKRQLEATAPSARTSIPSQTAGNSNSNSPVLISQEPSSKRHKVGNVAAIMRNGLYY